ncbi:MAG: efflux RND transporter periplasmic adaptor subunit, partial [Verrucomicrobiales bacterium]|nr:efflux RND transporter periplasmic adaptor subunit [Verrucomicrobiales bacterium]
MKRLIYFVSILSLSLSAPAEETEDIIILDETGVRNLRLETVVAEESDFSHTIATLGRIEAVPGASGVVSSRIAGRLVELKVAPGDQVEAGSEVARVESRQPGDPPPVVSLRAPIGGMVSSVSIRPGEAVEPERVLIEIIDLTEVLAVAKVPEYRTAEIAPGSKAEIQVDARAGESFEGTLLRFGTSADRETGTIDAVFRLANPDGRLLPGMRAAFSFVTGTRENVLSVPREALQGSGANRFVFVKHFDLPNSFVKAPVEVGEQNERAVEILSGIFPADEVVIRGAYPLSFAGAGSISLKEAMDAAHGHSHNEDGSEIGEGHGEGDEHGHDDHDHEGEHEHEHEHEHE